MGHSYVSMTFFVHAFVYFQDFYTERFGAVVQVLAEVDAGYIVHTTGYFAVHVTVNISRFHQRFERTS
jgi:hypothetical protein